VIPAVGAIALDGAAPRPVDDEPLVVILAVVPWRYAWRQHVAAEGTRWRS
jgi:hypothetical protein